MERWIGKVQSECGDSVAMVLVQNKVDLLDESVVEAEEAEQLAKSMRLKLYRTSVKENLQVDDVFEYLTRKYFKMEGDKGVEPEVNARKIGLFEVRVPRIIRRVGNSKIQYESYSLLFSLIWI